jgi:hypothetical protein
MSLQIVVLKHCRVSGHHSHLDTMLPRATQHMVDCGSEVYPWKRVINAVGDLRLLHYADPETGSYMQMLSPPLMKLIHP